MAIKEEEEEEEDTNAEMDEREDKEEDDECSINKHDFEIHRERIRQECWQNKNSPLLITT